MRSDSSRSINCVISGGSKEPTVGSQFTMPSTCLSRCRYNVVMNLLVQMLHSSNGEQNCELYALTVRHTMQREYNLLRVITTSEERLQGTNQCVPAAIPSEDWQKKAVVRLDEGRLKKSGTHELARTAGTGIVGVCIRSGSRLGCLRQLHDAVADVLLPVVRKRLEAPDFPAAGLSRDTKDLGVRFLTGGVHQ